MGQGLGDDAIALDELNHARDLLALGIAVDLEAELDLGEADRCRLVDTERATRIA